MPIVDTYYIVQEKQNEEFPKVQPVKEIMDIYIPNVNTRSAKPQWFYLGTLRKWWIW
jgi:hypothetical protein